MPSQQSTTIRKFFDEIKLALRWDEKYNILEIIQDPGNDYWYHICLKLDLPKKNKIKVAVNGENLGKVLDITDIPDKLYVKIGKGYFNVQFQ